MRLTKPVYSWSNNQLVISYDANTRDDALNFTGTGWVDTNYGLVKKLASFHPVVVTDTDLLAHDDYIEALRDCTVVLVFNTQRISASKLRLKRALAKLRASGIKVVYRASMESMERYVSSLPSNARAQLKLVGAK